MEIKSTPWPRLAPWLVLLVVAFAAGRWLGHEDHPPTLPSKSTGLDAPPAASESGGFATLDALLDAAQHLPVDDSRFAAFFENLGADRVPAVAADLSARPASPARDRLLLRVLRRWSAFAPAVALAHANRVGALPLRAEARGMIYETWAAANADSALESARAESSDNDREGAFLAVVTGAATTSVARAVEAWQNAPHEFRTAPVGVRSLARVAETAVRTGQREALQTTLAALPAGEPRAELTAALARYWGRYEPEAAVAWIKQFAPAGETQGALIDEVFSGFVRKDPVRAALWAAQQTDERRRSNYVATAVAEWAAYDSASAETWVNEQEQGLYLDGATSAIAAHFIEHRLWLQAFAWTRRILRNEARADLLGNLGRIWNAERPEEFSTFLAQTSLNRAELDMLRSKIVEVASP